MRSKARSPVRSVLAPFVAMPFVTSSFLKVPERRGLTNGIWKAKGPRGFHTHGSSVVQDGFSINRMLDALTTASTSEFGVLIDQILSDRLVESVALNVAVTCVERSSDGSTWKILLLSRRWS